MQRDRCSTRFFASDAGEAGPAEAVMALAAAITRSGDVAAIQKLVALVTDERVLPRFDWPLLQGVDKVLPAAGAPAGRGGRAAGSVALAGLSTPGAGEAFTAGRPVTLTAEPIELVRLGAGADPLASLAKSVVNKLDWPNRPVPAVVVAAVDPRSAEAVCRRLGNLQGTLHRLPSGRWQGKGQDRRESRRLRVRQEPRSECRHPRPAVRERRNHRVDAASRRDL